MSRYSALAVLSALLILSCPGDDDEQTVAGPANVSIPADIMGMVHAGYYYVDEKLSVPRTKAEEWGLMDEMGIEWMLRDFSWSSIQPSKDTWNLEKFDTYVADAEEYHKKILGLLAYDVGWVHVDCDHYMDGTRRVVAGESEVAAFCEYVRQTVDYYKGTVDAWCIWNEPNLQPRFWTGTPEEFFTLTKAAAAAIRAVDPDAIILGGALNTLANDDIWTKGLFESGAMAQIDYLAYHPYMPDASTSAAAYIRFKNYAAKYGFANKIWVTEVGYPLDMGPGGYDTKVSAEYMPETVIKTLTLIAAEGARKILWYEMFDHGAGGSPSNSEAWFGLVDRDTYDKKGGGEAYQVWARNIPGTTLRPSAPERSGVPSHIASYYFEGSDGKHSLIIWNNRVSRPQSIKVTLPGTNQQIWNVADGAAEPLGETTPVYNLSEGAGNSLLFFTWENPDPSKAPRIIP